MKPFLKLFLTGVLVFLFIAPSGSAAQQTKIINGSNASSKPWMVSMVNKTGQSYWDHFCGGVLIGPRIVITAAHCLEGRRAQDIDVIVGRLNLRKKTGQRLAAGRIYLPPLINTTGLITDPDIALIALSKSSSQKPLPLTISSDLSYQLPVTVLGWGATKNNYPATLQQTSLLLQKNNLCQDFYGPIAFNLESMICASAPGRGTCQADSGGPLLQAGILIGIVSAGGTCGQTPGVYARVAYLQDWIAEIINNPGAIAQIMPGKDLFSQPALDIELVVQQSGISSGDLIDIGILSNYPIQKSLLKISTPKKEYLCNPKGYKCFFTNKWLRQSIDFGRRSAKTSFFMPPGKRCFKIQSSIQVNVSGKNKLVKQYLNYCTS